MTARAVLKWKVPVDDQDHPIGSGPVVLVAVHEVPGVVYVWTVENVAGVDPRRARVYGTGHPVPPNDVHVGSAVHLATGLVWHVFGAPS